LSKTRNSSTFKKVEQNGNSSTFKKVEQNGNSSTFYRRKLTKSGAKQLRQIITNIF
jgi:hypothetical protein